MYANCDTQRNEVNVKTGVELFGGDKGFENVQFVNNEKLTWLIYVYRTSIYQMFNLKNMRSV